MRGVGYANGGRTGAAKPGREPDCHDVAFVAEAGAIAGA
jgi:hypothetical protein